MDTILYFQTPSPTCAVEKLAGVLEIAAAANWHVQVIEDFPTLSRLRALIEFWHPLGAIVECGNTTREVDPAPFALLPTVFFNHDPDSLPPRTCCVHLDSQSIAALAARELLTAGFVNFAFLHAPWKLFWSQQREIGFVRALQTNGRTCAVFRPGGGFGTIAFQRGLRGFLASLATPCAILAANDQVAAEALTAASALHLHVPDQLAVLGIDNYLGICERTIPPLSSIQVDFRTGGREAALTLKDLCNPDPGQRIRYLKTFGPLGIVRRASTRLLRFHDHRVEAALRRIRNEACLGLSAAAVLADFGCSRRAAELRFRAVTGHSILDEIHAVRLERAKELLANSGMQLKMLHDFCGFRTPCALQKFFLQQTGMTLSEWRRQIIRPVAR